MEFVCFVPETIVMVGETDLEILKDFGNINFVKPEFMFRNLSSCKLLTSEALICSIKALSMGHKT
jgi:hypothetical protein